jgi:acetyl esterase/lipase
MSVSLNDILEAIMMILAAILSTFSLLMSILLLIKTESPIGWLVLIPKDISSALSPIWALMGAIGALLGWVYQAFWIIPIGMLGAGMMIWYVWSCTRTHKGFEDAFGAGWYEHIPPEQSRQMVQRRWTWYLKMNANPKPLVERDFAFWTIPDTEQELLCDIWRPANGKGSGLAFIYYHGGGWAAFDKDFGTRPFFRHLVAQGHTVMDVAYRLIPEVDIFDMIGDGKRAIAWMKANADQYGVNPEKIVLGGGSAGGHLALLAAYSPEQPDLTPKELEGVDLSVCSVISYYGPTDLLEAYDYMNLQKLEDRPSAPMEKNLKPSERLQYAGRLDLLLGGWPKNVPAMYQLASPINHVHPGCPPTLLIQGKQDFVTSVDATNALYKKLVESGVPAVNVLFPWTDHAFDILLPQVNPAAQSALYDVDRFLALQVNKN